MIRRLKTFDDIFGIDIWNPVNTSWTYRGQWVDTDKYDIVPKKEYRERLLKQKEEELKELKERHEREIKTIEEDIKDLKKQE